MNFYTYRNSHTLKAITNSNGMVVGVEVYRDAHPVYYHRTSRGLMDFVHPEKGELKSFFSSERKMIQAFKNSTVLDLGCGGGSLVVDLQAKGICALGVDLVLSHDQEALPFFLKGDAFRLPYQNECFDVLISSYSVFHYEPHHQLRKVLIEAHRVLKKSGKLYLTPIDDHTRLHWILRLCGSLKLSMKICPKTRAVCCMKL